MKRERELGGSKRICLNRVGDKNHEKDNLLIECVTLVLGIIFSSKHYETVIKHKQP